MTFSADMTQGSVSGKIIRFTLPLLLGNLLQQTYNIADTLIVGKFLGDDALASVGSTGSITYLFYTLCIGLSIGSGIIVSQYFGAKLYDKLRMTVFNSAALTLAFGIVISVISCIFARNILTALDVPNDLLDGASQYMSIACAGTVCIAAYNWINALMRALGDSKTPLIFLAASCVMNILLDLLFVIKIGLGIKGAAAATVLSQGTSALMCIIYFFKKNPVAKLTKDDMTLNSNILLKCMATGIPIAAQNGLISVSMVALQSVTNSFGGEVMTAYTVSMRIEQFVQQPFSSLGAAEATFTGQNIGAGKNDRAIKGLRSSLKLSCGFAVAVMLLFFVFSKSLAGFFVSGEYSIDIASKALIMTSCFYVPLGMIHTIRGFLNGCGDTSYAIVNGMAEVITRIGLSLILTRISFIGFWGIWITTCATWVVTALVSILRYNGGKWKTKSKI
ncbi:MAG: MATE family efflux transporter [Ruminococcus sp.]|nr:MATE family efflux transporter [Ruminococcus sp.]